MSGTRSLKRHLPAVLLAALLLGIYLSTLAPGLTWANHGSDGGDLVTAAYTGGIAHPTGYPLYLLIARLYQAIPAGPLAFRTNLLSASAAVLAALLVQAYVRRALEAAGGTAAWFAGMSAGLTFGLAPIVWSQAVITEVYALQAFLTAAILFLFTFSIPGWSREGLERMRGLILGLAMGNHITTILLVPLMFASAVGRETGPAIRLRDLKTAASPLARQLSWFAVGLSVYLILPLRASSEPPVNWGDPVTAGRLWWLVSGELYRSYYLQIDFNGFWAGLQAWAAVLVGQFGWPGILLGVTGLVLLFRPARLHLFTLWTALGSSAFALAYASDDSHLYLIPLCISFSIWVGLGVGYAFKQTVPNYARWGLGLLVFGHLLFQAAIHRGQVDASGDRRAELFGRQVMTEVPKDALVFVRGDKAVFAAWYFHLALKERPDIAVIADELLHFDWYQETLSDTYPSLEIPGPYPWAQDIADANPSRPSCFVEYRDEPDIACVRP